jgi:hypothetical protein
MNLESWNFYFLIRPMINDIETNLNNINNAQVMCKKEIESLITSKLPDTSQFATKQYVDENAILASELNTFMYLESYSFTFLIRPMLNDITTNLNNIAGSQLMCKSEISSLVSAAILIPDTSNFIQKSDLYLNGDPAYDMRLNYYQTSGSTMDVVDKSSTYIRGYFMDTGTATNNFKNVAIGNVARVKSYGNTAIGYSAQCQSDSSVAVGHAAVAVGENSVAIGTSTESGSLCIAVGSGAKATGYKSIAIGYEVVNAVSYTTAIGTTDTTTIKLGPITITFSGDNIIFTKNSKTFTMNLT